MSVNNSEVGALSERYAKALFELALEKKTEAQVEQDLVALTKAIDTSSQLAALSESPIAPRKNLQAAYEEILKKIKASEITAGFVRLVVKNGRSGIIKAISGAYQKKSLAHKGTLEAEIHSAKTLSADSLRQVEKILKDTFKTEIRVSSKLTPEILGGIRVKVGSRLFDGSVATKIEKLELALKEGLQKNLI